MKTRIDRTGSAELTLPSDTEIRMERKFDAPAELVFDVWTTEEHVRNWWGYPEHPMTDCTIDLTVGGEYRYAADIEEAVADLAGRGIEVAPIRHMGANGWEDGPDPERRKYGSYSFFTDPDDNGWVLQEVGYGEPREERHQA